MTENIETKWQKKWDDEKLFESDPNDKEKLFITVAFPYPSGAMHIGHGRTYTVPDVYARFKRMEGYNVLFPMAWHVTGAPVIGIASRIQRKDSWTLDLYENVHKVPKETLPKMEDPEFKDKVRFDYIRNFGYYCTESREHNAEYNGFYIKDKYPELIDRYNIPLDEYPRRCVNQIDGWKKEYAELMEKGVKEHTRSREYASHIMEAVVTDKAYQIGGNVLNTNHLISNLPAEACVEVPCLVNGSGIHPCAVGSLPVQCAAMNMTNINVQLLTIEAARTHKFEHVYQAAMLDPHTGSELDIDTIKKMVDELIAAHGTYLPKFH